MGSGISVLLILVGIQFVSMLLRHALVALLLLSVFAQKEQHKVTSLPGYIDFTNLFDMYSGLLPLKQDPLMNMHYVFVSSMGKGANDPLVLWLNGGPGCSSLLGFTQEIGPCLLQPGSQAFDSNLNPYTWNRNASVLFLENPPGVGFSQNEDKNFQYNENNTAANAYLALIEWFKLFPEYQGKDFWITGESYCGMYIPYLANEIINRNAQAQAGDIKINLKGVMIGNGVMLTNSHWRRQARDTFYGKHQFYGPEITDLMKSCTYNDTDNTKPRCLQAQKLADQAVQSVNPYATIGLCYGIPPGQHIFSANTRPRRRFYYTPWFEQNNPMAADAPPCTDDNAMSLFFNDLNVKKQLHVDSVSTTWLSCNEKIGETYKKSNDSTWIFPILKTNGIKVMLYSGNTDAVVSHIETERYIQTIGWKQKGDTIVVKNEYGSMVGWRTDFDGLTYYVVNGAGHMVPTDRPYAAWRIFTEFLGS